MSGTVTGAPAIRLLCWNMGAGGPGQRAGWEDVRAETGVDAALLQEAPNPWRRAVDLDIVPPSGSKWGIGTNRAQTAVVRLSDRITITPLPLQPLGLDGPLEVGISRPGTVTVAKLTVLDTSEELLLVSVYAQWEGPISGGPGIFADASMHRILSDLSPLLSWRDLPIVVAGDFNLVHGFEDDPYGGNWTARTAGVFERMEHLGLRMAGPRSPHGQPAAVPPLGLPTGSLNVPTFVTNRGARNHQLDYCFVSDDLAHRVSVGARNSLDEWGPSDHCRLDIAVAPPSQRPWNEQSFLAEVTARVGPEGASVVADLLEWAANHQLRPEFVPGEEGQVWMQLDGGPDGLQYTFSIRTRGDVVIQFQWMRPPFGTTDEREALRQELNGLLPDFAALPADRLKGRPAVALRHLFEPSNRAAFLAVFSRLVERTANAVERP